MESKLITLLIVALLLFSCSARKKTAQVEKEVQVITKVETYRDTVFYTKKAETSFGIPLSGIAKCPEVKGDLNPVAKQVQPQIFTQKNGNAKATARVQHDSIFITAECDSIALEAKIRSEYESSDRNRESRETKEEKKGLNLFTIIGICVACFMGGIVAGFIAKKST